MAVAPINNRPLPRKYLSYNEDQNSKLHFASYFGDYKTALMLLLSSEVDINARNIWRETPLHHCTSQGHLDIMMLLLDGGADVNALDKDYYTPLHHAIIHGNKEATELLVCYGSNIFNNLIVLEISSHSNYNPYSIPKSPFELASSVHVCHSPVKEAQGSIIRVHVRVFVYCNFKIDDFRHIYVLRKGNVQCKLGHFI